MDLRILSDLHLEFNRPITPPDERDGDVLILDGDIVNFCNPAPLQHLLSSWRNKPIIYVPGNHEYYPQHTDMTPPPMHEAEAQFSEFLTAEFPNVHFLQNDGIVIEDVCFFGGTMWTDFDGGDDRAMKMAATKDFEVIPMSHDEILTPNYTTQLHTIYKERLTDWFNHHRDKEHVVIAHHDPVKDPNELPNSRSPAFRATDMMPFIDEHKPALWVYGHTHVPADYTIGATRLISNPRGNEKAHTPECPLFNPNGFQISL